MDPLFLINKLKKSNEGNHNNNYNQLVWDQPALRPE